MEAQILSRTLGDCPHLHAKYRTLPPLCSYPPVNGSSASSTLYENGINLLIKLRKNEQECETPHIVFLHTQSWTLHTDKRVRLARASEMRALFVYPPEELSLKRNDEFNRVPLRTLQSIQCSIEGEELTLVDFITT